MLVAQSCWSDDLVPPGCTQTPSLKTVDIFEISALSPSYQGFSQLESGHDLKRTAESTAPYSQSNQNPRVYTKWSVDDIYVYIPLSTEIWQEIFRNRQDWSENNADKGASDTTARKF